MMGINVNSLQSKPKGNDKDVVIFNAVFSTLSQQLRVKKPFRTLCHKLFPSCQTRTDTTGAIKTCPDCTTSLFIHCATLVRDDGEKAFKSHQLLSSVSFCGLCLSQKNKNAKEISTDFALMGFYIIFCFFQDWTLISYYE